MATLISRLFAIGNCCIASLLAPTPLPGDTMPIQITVSACCRSLSLRTGSLVIGYVYLVADLVMSTTIIAGAAFLEAAKQSLDEEQQYRLPDIEDTEGIMLGLWLLMLPFITFLIVGLHKNKPVYVKIYLMAVFAYILVELTMYCLCVYLYRINYYILMARTVAFAIDLYFFVVVRSQYYKMIQGA